MQRKGTLMNYSPLLKLMTLLALSLLPIGCAKTKVTQTPLTPAVIEYVDRSMVWMVSPGGEILPGATNTSGQVLWCFTKTGLKATIVKACDMPGYASGLLQE